VHTQPLAETLLSARKVSGSNLWPENGYPEVFRGITWDNTLK